MAEISAAAVKSLRERTGLPMMDCKKALQESGGNIDKAIELLRKAGAKLMEKRSRPSHHLRPHRRLSFARRKGRHDGRLALRKRPVAGNEHFVQLANDLAKQLAIGPGADSAEALLAQPSPSKAAPTLKQQFDDLNNRIREVFKVERFVRIDGRCGGYAHHNGAAGVLLQFEGGNAELASDICMHVAAMRPAVVYKEELDPAVVDKEREILSAAARKEGKPENIIAKMVEGRLRNFYAECCLAEQPFVKDDKKTVGQVAKEAGMKLVRFVRWELPKE